MHMAKCVLAAIIQCHVASYLAYRNKELAQEHEKKMHEYSGRYQRQDPQSQGSLLLKVLLDIQTRLCGTTLYINGIETYSSAWKAAILMSWHFSRGSQ